MATAHLPVLSDVMGRYIEIALSAPRHETTAGAGAPTPASCADLRRVRCTAQRSLPTRSTGRSANSYWRRPGEAFGAGAISAALAEIEVEHRHHRAELEQIDARIAEYRRSAGLCLRTFAVSAMQMSTRRPKPESMDRTIGSSQVAPVARQPQGSILPRGFEPAQAIPRNASVYAVFRFTTAIAANPITGLTPLGTAGNRCQLGCNWGAPYDAVMVTFLVGSGSSGASLWQVAGVIVSALALTISVLALVHSVRTRRLVPKPRGEMDVGWDMRMQPKPPRTDLFVKFRVHNRGTVPLHIRELIVVEAGETEDGSAWDGACLRVFGPDTKTIEIGGPPAEFEVDVLHSPQINWLNPNGVVVMCQLAGGEILAEEKLDITDERKACFNQFHVHHHILPTRSVTLSKARSLRRRRRSNDR